MYSLYSPVRIIDLFPGRLFHKVFWGRGLELIYAIGRRREKGAVLTRGTALFFFEGSVKSRDTGEPCLQSDIRNGQIGFGEEVLCGF